MIDWSLWSPEPVRANLVQLPLSYGRPQHKFAVVIENIFTQVECDALIAITEGNGYQKALLGTSLNMDRRNSDRSMIDSHAVADILWSRLQPWIPDNLYEGKANVVGINERFKFLRYDPGQYFKAHNDGAFHRNAYEQSRLTVQIYLNEGFKGGETTFVGSDKDGNFKPGRAKGNVPIVPKTGSALIFMQNIFHEGTELEEGRKYTVRTEVMYQNIQKFN